MTSSAHPIPRQAANSPAAASASATAGAAINYRLFLDCVHCGLCTAACPTYAELGDENDSPRGRIYLMRSVTDGRLDLSHQVRRHLDLCLDCRACETACPSGVQYGRLFEPFRVAMQSSPDARQNVDWFQRRILLGLMPYPRRLKRLLLPARLAQRIGLWWLMETLGLMNLLPPRLRQLAQMVPPPARGGRRLPEVLPAEGKRRARVAMFTGCVSDALFRSTNWATARVLQKNGCDVIVPRQQVCCGAIHFHCGVSEPARDFADANLAALDAGEIDAIVVNVAGCGAMLKDYGHHWRDPNQASRARFAAKIKDVHEFLAALGAIAPQGEINLRATYHDACHLAHAQKVREAPRKLLALIPGLEVRELLESELCCGAAGTYNLTQPEMADRLGRRKLQNILATGVDAVITANVGCQLQIARHARDLGCRLPIYHPMDLLDLSYRGKKPRP